MMEEIIKRTKFYSKGDFSTTLHLDRAVQVLDAYRPEQELTDINDVLELYNIQLYLKEEDLPWPVSKAQTDHYRDLTKGFGRQLTAYFRANSTAETAVARFREVSFEYQQDFWDVIDQYNLIAELTPDVLKALLAEDPEQIWNILHCKRIVDKRGAVLAEFLEQYPLTAELLAEAYLIRKQHPCARPWFIPSSLTHEQKNRLIERYLNSPQATGEMAQLISRAPTLPELKLGPGIRAAARKLEAKQASLPRKEHTAYIEVEISVEFDPAENIPCKDVSWHDNGQKLVYSTRYIDRCSDTQLFDCFHTLFEYTDANGRMNLCYNPREDHLLERIRTDEVKGFYRTNTFFQLKNHTAMQQLILFEHYLHQRGKSVESLMQHYYTRHFRTDYGYDPGHELSLPQTNDSYANKIKVLAPELESVVKRYDLFVEAGEVDPYLYEFQTGFRIDSAQSRLKEQHKYVVIAPEGKEIYQPMYLLFSDQTGLNHVAPYRDDRRFTSFYALLASGLPVHYVRYESWQKRMIDELTGNGCLKVEADGTLALDNRAKVEVLKQLWDRQEISYHHCTPEMQAEIKQRVDEGRLQFDDQLLSPSERHWVNFYLNDAEYSNGLKIRNRYAHGQGNMRPEEDRIAYYALLLVFITLLLKMDDDLALHQGLKSQKESE